MSRHLAGAAQIDALPVTAADAVEAARLPGRHRDPFDRMVIAQAMRLDALIVTRDPEFASLRRAGAAS